MRTRALRPHTSTLAYTHTQNDAGLSPTCRAHSPRATRWAHEPRQASGPLWSEKAWRTQVSADTRRSRNANVPARSAVARQAFEPNRTRGAGGAYGAGNTTDAEDRGARGASGTSDTLAPLGPTEADGPGGPARPGRATRASTPHLAARSNRPLGAVESVRPWGARRSWGRVAIGEMRQRPGDSAAARSAHQW